MCFFLQRNPKSFLWNWWRVGWPVPEDPEPPNHWTSYSPPRYGQTPCQLCHQNRRVLKGLPLYLYEKGVLFNAIECVESFGEQKRSEAWEERSRRASTSSSVGGHQATEASFCCYTSYKLCLRSPKVHGSFFSVIDEREGEKRETFLRRRVCAILQVQYMLLLLPYLSKLCQILGWRTLRERERELLQLVVQRE